MKLLPLSIILITIGIFGLFPIFAFTGGEIPDEDSLNNLDAIDAIKIANQWKWTQRGIKSYVTSREVVFKFPNGKVKKIHLPEEKMTVAIAPFIKKTHT